MKLNNDQAGDLAVPVSGEKTVVWTKGQQSRLDLAFGRLPYGALASFSYGLDPEKIIGNIETLGVVLRQVAERNKEKEQDLESCRRAIRGFGELLNMAKALTAK